MRNRIPNYLPTTKSKALPSRSSDNLLDEVQKQITDGMRAVETYVQEHPVTAIGAVFCIGIFLGWVIKRS
jgi:ElaB/YqjD/DUF883 family membrane-anchored ribosome-binding protein